MARLTLTWLISAIGIAFFPLSLPAQSIDSLRQRLQLAETETERIDLTNLLAFAYAPYSIDKARDLTNEALQIAETIHYTKGIADAYSMLGITFSMEGNPESGMEYFLMALRHREAGEDTVGIAKTLNNLAGVALYQRNHEKAITYSRRSLTILQQTADLIAVGNAYLSLGLIYQGLQNRDSSGWFFNRAFEVFGNAGQRGKMVEARLHIAGELEKQDQFGRAFSVLESVPLSEITHFDPVQLMHYHEVLGRTLTGLEKYPEALTNLQRAWSLARHHRNSSARTTVSRSLSELFQKTLKYDSALYYLDQHNTFSQEAMSLQRIRQTAILEKLYTNEKQEKALAISDLKLKRQTQTLTVVGILLLSVLILSVIQYVHYKRKKKTNRLLLTLNAELVEQQSRISAYAEEMEALNNQMELLNQSLEEKIKNRTAEISERNRKLIEYAFINAHHTRGPLARILGLVNLFRFQTLSPEVSTLVERLTSSAHELDDVVKKMNIKLAEENFTSETIH